MSADKEKGAASSETFSSSSEAPPVSSPSADETVALSEKTLEVYQPSASATEAKTPQAETTSGMAETVLVRPGDSLSLIAGRVYGDAAKWRLIYAANQDKIEDPNVIIVGMELVLPKLQN